MDDLLITAGRLFDGRADTTMARGFVHVRAGRIAALGRQEELGAEQGRFARVIDLGGEATLLPGLIIGGGDHENGCGSRRAISVLRQPRVTKGSSLPLAVLAFRERTSRTVSREVD